MVLASTGKFHVYNHKAIAGRQGGKQAEFSMKTKQRKPEKMNQSFSMLLCLA